MIPIRSLVRRSRPAVVTSALIAVNLVAFLFELWLGRWLSPFVQTFGLRPVAFLVELAHFDMTAWVPVFTSMFLHGGWLHLGGNMLFLWVFGSAVEDRLGHGRFLLLYLGAGVAAVLAQVFATPLSPVPTIGASGAIAGVLGAYLLLFPWSRVRSFVPVFIFLLPWDVPAPVFLLLWFAMQFASGMASLQTGQALYGGVAYWAHVGGFMFGLFVAYQMKRTIDARRTERWDAPYRWHTPG